MSPPFKSLLAEPVEYVRDENTYGPVGDLEQQHPWTIAMNPPRAKINYP